MIKNLFIFFLKIVHRVIHFLFPYPKCRFFPTCSDFTYEAISEFGILKGILLGAKRLLKCHPFHPGGYDPLWKKET